MFSISVAAINHLLRQSGWALQRLAAHQGKTARFNIAPFSFAYTLAADGSLCKAEADAVPDVTCNIAPSLLPRLAVHDENAFAQITSQGDAALLSDIFYLSRHLRWDAAEDISHYSGDIAAERLVQLLGTGRQQLRSSTLNLAQAFAEYWTEERPLVAKSSSIHHFVQQVDVLRDDVSRLEQRINRLSQLP